MDRYWPESLTFFIGALIAGALLSSALAHLALGPTPGSARFCRLWA
jgi:hypothetical protein